MHGHVCLCEAPEKRGGGAVALLSSTADDCTLLAQFTSIYFQPYMYTCDHWTQHITGTGIAGAALPWFALPEVWLAHLHTLLTHLTPKKHVIHVRHWRCLAGLD
jgi:hypothetical protein